MFLSTKTHTTAIFIFVIFWKTTFIESASFGIGLTPSGSAPCIDQPNDVLLPVFGECSQFYGCKNGKAILRNCMESFFFDSITKNCTEPSKSDCVQEQKNSAISEVQQSHEIPEIPRYICLGKAIGAMVPSKTNCSEYYSCVSSRPTLESCGIGSHFDTFGQRCIPAELSNCVIQPKVHIEVSTTPKPKLIEVVCKGKFDGEKFPVPGNCSKYFDCVGHKAFEKSCGDKHFYPVSRTCIDPEVSECFEGNVIVKPSTTEANSVEDRIIEGNNVVTKGVRVTTEVSTEADFGNKTKVLV